MSPVAVLSKSLAEACAAVSPVASVASSMPIVNHLRVTASGGEMRIAASNREAYAARTIECEGECDLLLPAKSFTSAAKSIGSESLSITPDGKGGAVIEGGASKFKLPGLPDPEDFRGRPSWEGITPVELSKAAFSEFFRGPILAASDDMHEAVLRCVSVERIDDVTVAVATNRHRLHYSQGDFNWEGGLVPSEFLEAAAKLPGDLIEVAKLSDGTWGARSGGSEVAYLGYAGNYPNWQRVVPSGSPTLRARLPRLGIIDSVRRMTSVMSSVRVEIDTSSADGLALSIPLTPEGQQCDDFVPCEVFPGGGRIAFNPKYLIDALNSLTGDEIEFRLEANTRPAIFKGDSENFALIMPMALAVGS